MHYILHHENICNALCIKALSKVLLNIKRVMFFFKENKLKLNNNEQIKLEINNNKKYNKQINT